MTSLRNDDQRVLMGARQSAVVEAAIRAVGITTDGRDWADPESVALVDAVDAYLYPEVIDIGARCLVDSAEEANDPEIEGRWVCRRPLGHHGGHHYAEATALLRAPSP